MLTDPTHLMGALVALAALALLLQPPFGGIHHPMLERAFDRLSWDELAAANVCVALEGLECPPASPP